MPCEVETASPHEDEIYEQLQVRSNTTKRNKVIASFEGLVTAHIISMGMGFPKGTPLSSSGQFNAKDRSLGSSRSFKSNALAIALRSVSDDLLEKFANEADPDKIIEQGLLSIKDLRKHFNTVVIKCFAVRASMEKPAVKPT